jgi:5'-3' exonuclease
VKVHLLDGTYELFRHHFGAPSHVNGDGHEVAATRAVLGSVMGMLEGGVTHLGVATDHVIESFRNFLYAGYKTSAGMDPLLLAQFGLLEEALTAMGVHVWPMEELEADDAMASAAAVAADDTRVEQVIICTPDKDLGQCVVGDRVVQLDRRKDVITNEEGVIAKFGVTPEQIPDYLALVGDSADGFPGLPGFGAKTAAAVLRRFGHLEDIPDSPAAWDVRSIRGAGTLAKTLAAGRNDAMLFRLLATLRVDRDLLRDVDQLCWTGPMDTFGDLARWLDAPRLPDRAAAVMRKRAKAGGSPAPPRAGGGTRPG